MSELLNEIQNHVCIITLNRTHKQNAFDDNLLSDLQRILDDAQQNPKVHVILLKANGRHFSAGADIDWMQRMSQFTQKENIEDAMILARLMYTLHHCPIPTIAMIQGSAFGGGAGLVAACDIAIAAETAKFCFSEVKLGLIPAVISPYVIKAIGERAAAWLFMSAEIIDAKRAFELQLIQHYVPEEALLQYTLQYAMRIASLAPQSVKMSKALVRKIAHQPINDELVEVTAALIAEKRVSIEGQRGLRAFLNKETPNWDNE